MRAFKKTTSATSGELNHERGKLPRDFFVVTPAEEAALAEFEPMVKELTGRRALISPQSRNDCLRLLRARGLNTTKALILLENSEDERAEYSPVAYKDVKEIVHKGLAYMTGFDDTGRPVIYVDTDKFRKHEDNVVSIVKFIIFIMDEVVLEAQKHGQEQVVLVFDLTRFSLLSMDYGVIKQMLHVLMYVYPERVYRLIVFNPPYFFTAAWPAIKLWLDENSMRKILFLRKTEKLFLEVDKQAIPTILGGKFVFDLEKYEEKAEV
uniref:CRAL-TRIO domain-containing protein n=1 Tax=Rhodosorus marinus TaxID=101924 RepID=A0A7S0G3K4_9RHOD|mmetsp:Transcript_2995/g.4284  ORF Transcript_2995/g.4284 Transcript_2995/m.4284 type:complete len:265 (+) Transcript_2995:254-1048(+)